MVAITPIVRNLLIINILVFAIQNLVPINFVEMLGLRYVLAEEFAPYQLFTYFFVHGSFLHIFSNMLGLYSFGSLLERRWGGKRFLFFYAFCAIGAGLLHSVVSYFEYSQLQEMAEAYLKQPSFEAFETFVAQNTPDFALHNDKFMNAFSQSPTETHYLNQAKTFVQDWYFMRVNTPTVGASGAIFGVLMAFAFIFPNLEMLLLFPPIPIKAKYFVSLYALYEIYAIWDNSPKDQIAHFAHLGGLIFGFILLKIWREKKEF